MTERIYEVTILSSSNITKPYNVLAKSAEQAAHDAERMAKKEYYSGYRVTRVVEMLRVDVHYKS